MTRSIAALMWKNQILRKNTCVFTFFELCLAALVAMAINRIPFPLSAQRETIKMNVSSHMATLAYDRIIYTPSNAFTDQLMSKVADFVGMNKSNVIPGNLTGNASYEYGIEFSTLTNYEESANSVLNYTIYPSSNKWPKSFPLWASATSPMLVDQEHFLSFTQLKHYISLAFTALRSVELQETITFKEMNHLSSNAMQIKVVLYFVLAIFHTPLIISLMRIVEDNTTGAKELMLMMGVRSWELWMARLIDALLASGVAAALILIVLFVPFREDYTVLHTVNPLFFWSFLMAGTLALLIFTFFVSCLIPDAMYITLYVDVVGTIAMLLLLLVQFSEVARWKQLVFCLIPYMCVYLGAFILIDFEYYGKSVNLYEQLSHAETITIFDIFIMMIIDIIIYGILTAYLSNVRPGNFGVPQPYGFCFMKSYWCGNRFTKDDMEETSGQSSSSGISIQNLTKEFRVRGRPNFVAVDNVSMEVPAGEITALLGHNGAGKTTTMSIITGLIPATSGTVIINGHNLRGNPTMARKSIGLCPQQDFLFNDLTSVQIITFFGVIKGMSFAAAAREANELLKFLKMEGAANTLTSLLSGGMKRKVALGIALVGGSSIVILDEPASGVDAMSRREICDLLLTFRGKRTILLTTHNMEEADAVSDRIVILNHGKIQCHGTPMALKAQFGTGYTLSIVTPETGDDKALTEKIKGYVTARARPRNVRTISYQLPQSEASKFPAMFEMLDNLKASGKIYSYSVSVATLEDVFIRVRDIEKQKSSDNPDVAEIDDENPPNAKTMHSGCSLIFCQLAALLKKKWLEFGRLWVQYSIFIGIPLAIILFNLFIKPLISSDSDEHWSNAVSFSEPLYPDTKILLAFEHNCSSCRYTADSFQELAKSTGFSVTASTQNITFDVESIFLEDYHQYSQYLLLAVNFTTSNVEVIHNTRALHAVPVAVDLIHNAALRAINGSGRIVSNLNLSYVKESLEKAPMMNECGDDLQDVSAMQAMFYMSALLLETNFGAKSLQLMTVSPTLFWFSHLLFDFATFFPYISVVIGLNSLGCGDHAMFEHIDDLCIAAILWGACLIQVSYFITCFVRKKAHSIYAFLFYTAIGFVLWNFISSGLINEYYSFIHPNMVWKVGLLKYGMADERWYLIYLLIYNIALFVFLCFADVRLVGRFAHGLLSALCCCVKYDPIIESDSDVELERQAVEEAWSKDNESHGTLMVRNIRRFYGLLPPRAAVRGVSFRAMPGECFGLLGVNGAGKSTTFNILAAQIAASGGDAKINSKRLTAWWVHPYLNEISYCPQSSGILPILKGREYLELLTKLRGYKGAALNETVDFWIKCLDLEDSADRQCGDYSGGTQRKLSSAAVFLNDAPVVMLDEPTSGIDPVARRNIWKAVHSAQKAGKVVVLTSHSMDECDALCSRVAIMVSGSFRCIGETATLKNKFGTGYSVQVKLEGGTQKEIEKLKKGILDTLGPDCQLTDEHGSMLHYHVLDRSTNWKTLFQRLEELKTKYKIFQSYMASETTLEEIFLSFAGRESGLTNVPNIDNTSG